MKSNWARARRFVGSCAGGLVVFAAAALGQTGSIAGRVVTVQSNPAPDARVELLELRRQSPVDADGRFRFAGIPVGSYLVQATSPRFGDALARVGVSAGAEQDVTLTLERAVHREQVVVSASAEARRPEEVVQPVGSLGPGAVGADLDDYRGHALESTRYHCDDLRTRGEPSGHPGTRRRSDPHAGERYRRGRCLEHEPRSITPSRRKCSAPIASR